MAPLNAKGQKIYSEMVKEYGEKKGRKIFYSMINSGKITDVERPKTEKKK